MTSAPSAPIESALAPPVPKGTTNCCSRISLSGQATNGATPYHRSRIRCRINQDMCPFLFNFASCGAISIPLPPAYVQRRSLGQEPDGPGGERVVELEEAALARIGLRDQRRSANATMPAGGRGSSRVFPPRSDEIAEVIGFVASPRANYGTDAVIAVDGCRTVVCHPCTPPPPVSAIASPDWATTTPLAVNLNWLPRGSRQRMYSRTTPNSLRQSAGFRRPRRPETTGIRIGETPVRAPAVMGRTASALVSDPGVGGSPADISRISPVPAYSRTCRIPATADGLSSKAFETAMTVPSGAFSRNLYRECASRKSSNSPAIAGLPPSQGRRHFSRGTRSRTLWSSSRRASPD